MSLPSAIVPRASCLTFGLGGTGPYDLRNTRNRFSPVAGLSPGKFANLHDIRVSLRLRHFGRNLSRSSAVPAIGQPFKYWMSNADLRKLLF